MLDRKRAIRVAGTKLAVGLALAASLTLAACGGSTSTGSGTPGASPLTACTATAADLAARAGGKGTATKDTSATGKLAIDGSSALAPLFTDVAAEFDTANGTQTVVTPNGSGTGLKDVAAGSVQIGMSDVFALEKDTTPPAYGDLKDHQVAVVAFTLFVNNDLKGKVGNLTKAQIQQIYLGQVTSWGQLGGPNEAITVVNRPASSGTRATFKKYVLDNQDEKAGSAVQQDTTGAVVTAVAATPGAIGYASTGGIAGQYAGQVSPLCIDGHKADAADINSGSYAFWAIEHAYTKGPASGTAKAFLRYALGDQVQGNDLARLNYFKVSAISPAAIAAHTPSGAPAPEALS
jgi:phosphate transport system substrate-binding protein